MKKALLVIWFSFCVLSFKAQVSGVRFVPDSSYYKEYMRRIVSSPNVTYYSRYEYKYFLGDTTIDNKFYQHVSFTTVDDNYQLCVGEYLVYTDSGRTWLDSILIYDFNLNTGDSIILASIMWTNPQAYIRFYVTQTDSIHIGGITRKRIYLNDNTGFTTQWVQGIGDINYGFALDYLYLKWLNPAGMYNDYLLWCYSEHFQSVYADSPSSSCELISVCEGVVDLTETIHDKSISVFPNPTKEMFTVSCINTSETTQLQLIDINMKTVMEKFFKLSTTEDISTLPSGIYTIRIIDADKITNKRLVVIH